MSSCCFLDELSPARFVRQVGDEKRAIKGLDDGIRGMKAGGTRRIVVPPEVSTPRVDTKRGTRCCKPDAVQ